MKWTLSQIYEASSVALVSPLTCALLCEQSVKAFLTLWLIWIVLNRCGQVLLVSLTTLPKSYDSVPAGLLIWIELLSCWPSLVTRLTCLLKELKLLTKPSRRPTHLTRVRCCWPGLTPNPIHRALKMCADPSIQASPFQKVNVAWCAKHKGYCLDEALQSCLYLRSALAAPRKSQASFSNKVV